MPLWNRSLSGILPIDQTFHPIDKYNKNNFSRGWVSLAPTHSPIKFQYLHNKWMKPYGLLCVHYMVFYTSLSWIYFN